MLLAANAGMYFCTGTNLVNTFVKLFTQGLDMLEKFGRQFLVNDYPFQLLFRHVWNNRLKKNTVIFGFGGRFSCPFAKELSCIEINLLTVDCLLAAACYKKNCSGNSQVPLHNFIEKTLWSVRFLQLSNIFSVLLVKLNRSCFIARRDIHKNSEGF